MSKTYTTVQGDMWDNIAFTQLGSSEYLDVLINSNRKYREYYIFPAGIVLTLPDVPASVSSTAPPWKR
ncbi:MAG: tail protein X [Clostridia bacterium]|nr:tail protein X [Clostridia bacterium]